MNHKECLRFLKKASYKDLLRLWRFEPNGSQWFAHPLRTRFYEAFDRERNKLTIQDQMEISKEIGFTGGATRGAFDQQSELEG
jgi:hypothetical protein